MHIFLISGIFFLHTVFSDELTGTLLDAGGSSLSGCDVRLQVNGSSTQSDNNGQFQLTGLPVLGFKSTFRQAGPGPSLSGTFLSYRLEPGRTGVLELLDVSGSLLNSVGLKSGGSFRYDLRRLVPAGTPDAVHYLRVKLDSRLFSFIMPPLDNHNNKGMYATGSGFSSKPGRGLTPDTLAIYCRGQVAKYIGVDTYDQNLGEISMQKSPNLVLALADDASFHFSAYGNNDFMNTPNFDEVAAEGILFNHVFVPNPKCAPMRAATLTARNSWQIEEAANHYGNFPAKFKIYPKVLQDNGYFVGFTGKGWGPGTWQGTEWANPAGPRFNNINDFLNQRPDDQPFCFWFGSQNPHRGWPWQQGVNNGKSLDDVVVPDYYPDVDSIKHDILDYAIKAEAFDNQVGNQIQALKDAGEWDNTVFIVSSDHGYPFPRGKGQLYDEGTRVPASIRWGDVIEGGRIVDDFISFIDLGPTYLDLAGIPPEPEFTGISFLHTLLTQESGLVDQTRTFIVAGKERHDGKRSDPDTGDEEVAYPVRIIRTADYLYMRNFKPKRWMAGDPPCYNNIDNSPTKIWLIDHKDEPENQKYFDWAMGKRPLEELYDMKNDPHNINNLAGDPAYAAVKDSLWTVLEEVLIAQQDPRALGNGDVFDEYPHFIGAGTCAVPSRLQ